MDAAYALCFPCIAGWEQWLGTHHRTSSAQWVCFARKRVSSGSLTYKQAVEVALCFGWIDGQVKSYDAFCYLQRFTPRRKGSLWSAVNRARVEELLKAGRLQPAGLAAIEEAKANGRWETAYRLSGAIPADLAQALEGSEAAKAQFWALGSQGRSAILFRLLASADPGARKCKLRNLIARLERGEAIVPKRSGGDA